nr:MAG TPA: hypothetical protein [Caudoviricetes sp.]
MLRNLRATDISTIEILLTHRSSPHLLSSFLCWS